MNSTTRESVCVFFLKEREREGPKRVYNESMKMGLSHVERVYGVVRERERERDRQVKVIIIRLGVGERERKTS